MLIAKNIQWDIDIKEGKTYEEMKEVIGLPDDMEIPDGVTDEDEISDYLSEETGFCHYGFDLMEIEKENQYKQFTVVGYDKDNDVYVEYKQFHQRTVAEAFAKELKKGIEKGTLTRKCSDGTLEPIDWVQVVDSEDFDKVFWTSYECQERNKEEVIKERLANLPVISKELADRIVSIGETELDFFESQSEAMNRMSFSELETFIREHSESVMAIGRDDVRKRMIIQFHLDSVLSASLYQNMDDNHVYLGDTFGIWNEEGKHLGFFDVNEINHMLLRAYEAFFENAASIEYKGIVFDEWTVDEDTGLIYGEMCEHCAKKYKDILADELSDGGMGACSVKGCDVVGMDADTDSHYYVDFKPELIRICERKTAKEYALEVYEKEGSFVRQIDVLSTPEECIKMAEELSDECLDNEEFHITEIVYELLSDGSIGEELESSTARLVDCL